MMELVDTLKYETNESIAEQGEPTTVINNQSIGSPMRDASPFIYKTEYLRTGYLQITTVDSSVLLTAFR